MNNKETIPKEIINCVEIIEKAGFEAYLVGGCVRDLFLGKTPKDWDITTNASPEQIQAIFPKTVYKNTFGTVMVVDENTKDLSLKNIQITPYRLESIYSDHRHPDQVKFSKNLKDDLKRRDFTINSIAVNLSNGAIKDIVDLFGGFKDIKDKIIKAVDNPSDRFSEDALRMFRAIRLAVQLGFAIEEHTYSAIKELSKDIKKISIERIRDEFEKIIMTENPKKGIELLHESGLLMYFIPELEKGIGVNQNQAHKYDVWEHLLRSLQHAADKKMSLELRLSALFHDISKPKTKDFSRENNQITFYGHELVGSRETRKILERLRFSRATIDKVVKLVRWHMFFSDTEQITLSAVRRMIVNVGRENIWDLIDLRICDRIGTGRPKENPYRLRKYKSMIDEALHDPISVKMLKIDGNKIMNITNTQPGPKIGYILNALMEEVLDNPKLNNEEYLVSRVNSLISMTENELRNLAKRGKQKRDDFEQKNLDIIKKKHHI